MELQQIISIAQLIVSLLLVGVILIQKGKGSGQLIGGGGRFYRTLRGAEKKVFWATAFLGFLFLGLGVLNLAL